TESTVYPVLARLRKDGYLKVRVASSPDGPPRQYFSLTALGRQRVSEMNQYWGQLSETIDTLLAGASKKGALQWRYLKRSASG
ncbi:MAG: PadR family transcriptional regulator, partial [Planctomycetota bacterium]